MIPAHWPGYSLDYRFGETLYRIEVRQNPGATLSLSLDGRPLVGLAIPLLDDGSTRRVLLTWPAALPAQAGHTPTATHTEPAP